MKEARDPESADAEQVRDLRQRAEERLRITGSEIQRMSSENVQRLVHELQVSQVELLLQNEELQRTQAELAAARDRYSDWYDFAPVGYVALTPEGVILEANLAAAELLRTERRHLVGTLLSRFISANARDTLYRHLYRLRAESAPGTCEVSVPRPGEEPIMLQLESVAVRDEKGGLRQYRTILSDITARKQIETALHESEERFRLVAQVTHDLLFDWDLVTNTVWRSEGFQHLFGAPSGGGDNRWWVHRIHPDDRAKTLSHLQAALLSTALIHRNEYRLQKPDGEYAVVADTLYIVRDERGKALRVLGAIMDITARKETEAVRQALSRQLLEVQEHERRHLARELHDEVMQTLATLRYNLETIERAVAGSSEPVQESMELVDDLVEQVRNLALDLRPSVLDDLGLMAALDWYLKRQAPRVGLQMSFSTDPLVSRLHPIIETTCFRVVQEALTNVAKHAQAQHVWVELRQQADAVHISIRDDGIGFDPAVARQRAAQGSGLGLRGMEERLWLVGGHLDILSTPGGGCEIHANVPLREPLSNATVHSSATA